MLVRGPELELESMRFQLLINLQVGGHSSHRYAAAAPIALARTPPPPLRCRRRPAIHLSSCYRRNHYHAAVCRPAIAAWH